MIREKGSKAKTIHSKEEIKNIVKETHSFTINSLKHFCDLLGIDKKLLKHIYSTDVIIDYTDEINYESAVAFYKSNENKVHLLAEYVDEVLELQARDNNPVYVHNLSATILHELLHANRDIYIKGGTTEYDCLSSTKNLIQYENLSQKFGHLITGKFPIEALSYTKQHSQYMVSAYNNNTNSFFHFII